MKAITTTYHGPTNTRGARISADDSDGNRVTVPYLYEDEHRSHDNAAFHLCDKMGWNGTLLRGSIRRGYVYVWQTDDAIVERAS